MLKSKRPTEEKLLPVHAQVNAIVLCTLLEIVACAFQLVSLHYMYFNRDHWLMPLVVLPQYLELILLNIPGLLPRLSQKSVAEPTSGNQEERC